MASTAQRQPSVVVTPQLADGIEYRNIPGAPAPSFGCVRYRAQLLTTACAKRWRLAQATKGWAAEQIERCRGCPIGAAHAGERAVTYSVLYATDVCSRCGRGSTRRLVGGTRCISCYNRERESIKGRNRKGTRPTMAPLFRRSVRFAVEGGGIETRTIDHSADLVEVMLGALRSSRGKLLFHFNGRQTAGKAEAA